MVHVLPENIAIQQYDNLRDRRVELVLGRLPTTMTESDLVAEPLFDEPNVVVAGSESRWAKRRKLTLADLIGEPWVLAPPRAAGECTSRFYRSKPCPLPRRSGSSRSRAARSPRWRNVLLSAPAKSPIRIAKLLDRHRSWPEDRAACEPARNLSRRDTHVVIHEAIKHAARA